MARRVDNAVFEQPRTKDPINVTRCMTERAVRRGQALGLMIRTATRPFAQDVATKADRLTKAD